MEIDTLISEQYIEKAMNGDPDAFTWVYKTYSQRVHFFAVKFFKDENVAEDIVQEVFIQVYKKIHTLQSAKAFSSWLYVLTYRMCINDKRSKIVLLQFENEGEEELLIDDKAENIKEYLENKKIREIIIESLDTMSLPLQSVGQMKFLNEMKNTEIAEILKIPKSTVASQLTKIKKILQVNLEKNGFSYKSYSVVIASPMVLQEAYNVLCNKYAMNESVTDNILEVVLKDGTVTNGGKSVLRKGIYGGLSIAVILSVILWYNQPKMQSELSLHLKMPEMQIEEQAEIINIIYATKWQQASLSLDIKTTNTNYDKITVNDVETLKISSNGTYIVKLIKNDKVIDEEEIVITNIDRNSPLATSYEDDQYYYFYVTDDASGVNKDTIQYLKNGVVSNEFTYIEDTLRIPKDKISSHDIYIRDYAGNVLTINIK